MATRKSGKRDKRKSTRTKKASLGKSLGAGKTGKSGKDPKKRLGDRGRKDAGVDDDATKKGALGGTEKAAAKNEGVDTGSATTSRGWAALADLLGRRAGMRVLWELRAEPLKFRALQAACDGLSPSTLNQRLADLREARLVAIEERQGYCLTPQGEELVEKLAPLAGWAETWSHRRAQTRRIDGPPRKRARGKLG